MKGPQLLQSSGILVPDNGIQTFYGQLDHLTGRQPFQTILNVIQRCDVPSSIIYDSCINEFSQVHLLLNSLIPNVQLRSMYDANLTQKGAYGWALNVFLLEKAYNTDYASLVRSHRGHPYYTIANKNKSIDFACDLGWNLLAGC